MDYLYVSNTSVAEPPLLAPSTASVTNRNEGRMRCEMLEGRKHFVIDMVMLVEGTHAGSRGPIYYPANVLRNSAPLWDGRPVVVYHPDFRTSNFAGNPLIFSRQKIGTVFHTKFDRTRLIAEAWLDAERTKEVDNRVYEAVVHQKVLEVSTGLIVVPNAHDDNSADSLFPDHLAILPDQIGACSIADGCGLARNTSEDIPLPLATL